MYGRFFMTELKRKSTNSVERMLPVRRGGTPVAACVRRRGIRAETGVHMMITFGDFRRFSTKKLAFFLKNQCFDEIFV
jgi:hypothetical protein